MSGKAIPPSQIPAHQIATERLELENLRYRLSEVHKVAAQLKGLLGEIADRENAAREILKATSPDSPQDAYERRQAKEALEDLAEERADTEEQFRRRQVVIKSLNSQVDALHVSEIERRGRIDALAARLARPAK
jgi:DNA repair exonuclease SbcCD ATPase subunit